MSEIYDVKTYVSRTSVGRLISRARVELVNAVDKELAQFDITAAQYVVLATLADDHADSAAQLCKEISYNQGAMTRMIDRLEQKGLLRRVRSHHDRRIVQLELTDEGKAINPVLRTCSVNVSNRLLRGFSKDEVRQFESFLERMLANS
ncbi:MAG: MarR family winged helix-turn-helix transcriptional regulator [Burkholderiales bacterium]